jgi:phosphoribosylamine--glycine ligase
MKTDVVVIGAGGREHALCWKLSQSAQVGKVICMPGNGGIAQVAECINVRGVANFIAFCKEQDIGLVVIGPEQPLVDGLSDELRAANIPVFGPSRRAAQLEASKAFTKALCRKYEIPTAKYAVFTDLGLAKAYLKTQHFPVVLKADGLAAGKGVIIADSRAEAEAGLTSMFSGAFGEAGRRVVIEEFLTGPEVSFFALCDGERAVPFGAAQDHKRAFDGDTGPNTGGMGAYSPAPVFTPALERQVMETIVQPTVGAMRKEGAPFSGVLFAGLMLTQNGPKLLEYNVRFGDPETQALMCRLESDLYPLLMACAKGNLAGAEVRMRKDAALCVVMAAKGYPGAYAKGSIIHGLDGASALSGVQLFHAGTEKRGSDIIATGGRVLSVCATGSSIRQAETRAYGAVDAIRWPEGFCRRDIGWRAA